MRQFVLFSVSIFSLLLGSNVFAQSGSLIGDTAYSRVPNGQRIFFEDVSPTYIQPPELRQLREQDIVRVKVMENSSYVNESDYQRQKRVNSRYALTEIFTFESLLGLPVAKNIDAPSLGGEINGQNRSNGSIENKEVLKETVACKVVTVYDNGTLYIEGTRYRGVGEESKKIFISGIIRPLDIDERTNTVSSDSMAEFVYREVPAGAVYDSTRRSYGARWFDHWMPF